MHVRSVTGCLVLSVLLLAACSATETGTALPGIVASTSITSIQPGTTLPGSTVTLAGPTVTVVVTSNVTESATTSVIVRSTLLRATTVTKTVTAGANKAQTVAHTPGPAAPAAGWTHQPNSDGTDSETFPDSLAGWTMTNNWQSGPKAFSSGFTPATGIDGGRFPSTMSGCGSQRFLVLWHVQNVTVTAAWLDDTGATQSPVTGSSGWFDLDSCETPAFQAMASSGGVADISVDVQQYVTAG